MNPKFATMILTATLLATLGANSLKAEDKAIAKIPFSFHVRSSAMPAGTYEVKHVENGGLSLFTMSDHSGHSLFLDAHLQGKANPDDPKLTFACTAGDCSLMRIELPGSSISHGLYPAKSAKVGIAAQVAIAVSH